MPQAAAELQSNDRDHRAQVYQLITDARLAACEELDSLFDKLIKGRHQVALNAGFENFRDYQFAALARFYYSPADCKTFHESVKKYIVPISAGLLEERRKQMNLDRLKPWDLSADPKGRAVLKPFSHADELLKGSIKLFNKLEPYFGECLQTMGEMGYLDLASKEGKAPGGYNYPLYETGVPFIFMNAVGTPRDLVTMVHEGGHAVHSFLTRDLHLTSYKSCPSEVAELASMSMELLSMDYWDEFYTDPGELRRAKKEQLEDVLSMLPWIALIDKFQHWIYEHPSHAAEERSKVWVEMLEELSPNLVDWTGFEKMKATQWQKQLHLFEVPFYYIEYGMAQLGAIAVWRNYKMNPSKAIQQFMDALSLGYTAGIPAIYDAAGIKFDFSAAYLQEIAAFVESELDLLRD
jgi:oligoendopeptidase F